MKIDGYDIHPRTADFARDHGATALEVYPTDTDEDKHPVTVFTGIASTFRRLGSETVQAKAPHKRSLAHCAVFLSPSKKTANESQSDAY